MNQSKADGEETWGSEGKHSIHLPEVSHRAGYEAAPAAEHVFVVLDSLG